MDLNDFMARKNENSLIKVPPSWFIADPTTGLFILRVPKDDKNKRNFQISDYDGCLPHFVTKVAGVTYEGRGNMIRKANGILNKGASAKAHLRLMRDANNKHHENAIKVLLMIKSGKEVLMREVCVGYVPAKLANFIRYCEEHGVEYKCSKPEVSGSKKWVSVGMKLTPIVLGEAIPDEHPDDKPIRTPMVKKAITGTTIEDFRNALLKPKKGNR